MPRPTVTRARPYTPTSGKLAGQTFTSERQYRNALARVKGFANWDAQRQAAVATGSRVALERLRPSQLAKRDQALDVLALMRRHDLDLTRAIRAHNRGNPSERLTREAALRYIGTSLDERSGILTAKPHDRLLRLMRFPTEKGSVLLEIKDSRTASKIGSYNNAVKTYLATGDETALRRFRGKTIRSNKRTYPFITDPELLKRLSFARELHLDSIYEHAAAR